MTKPKLLQSVRGNLRLRHLSPRSEEADTDWTRRFVRFRQLRHPSGLGEPEVTAFLFHLAQDRQLAPLTLAQGSRPCSFFKKEDFDLEGGEILIRRGKGANDRVTVQPELLRPALAAYTERGRRLHARDGSLGDHAGWVTCHTWRHSFATPLLESGAEIRTVQERLGDRDAAATMLYTHMLNRGGLGVRSPADGAGFGDLVAGFAFQTAEAHVAGDFAGPTDGARQVQHQLGGCTQRCD